MLVLTFIHTLSNVQNVGAYLITINRSISSINLIQLHKMRMSRCSLYLHFECFHMYHQQYLFGRFSSNWATNNTRGIATTIWFLDEFTRRKVVTRTITICNPEHCGRITCASCCVSSVFRKIYIVALRQRTSSRVVTTIIVFVSRQTATKRNRNEPSRGCRMNECTARYN